MKIIKGNLWSIKADYKGIPTNGFVKKNGRAVMGRGVALQARETYKDLDLELGIKILKEGNVIHFLSHSLFSFPVKHNWWGKADIELIKNSVGELKDIAYSRSYRTFAIPLPGTGNGKLNPEQVWPLLKDLPNNVIIVELES